MIELGGVVGLLTVIGSIVLFVLRKRAKKKTPQEKFNADKANFDENLAHGDGLGLSYDFERMRDEFHAGDRGHTSGQSDKKPPER